VRYDDISGEPVVSYVPDTGFYGVDTFRYQLQDTNYETTPWYTAYVYVDVAKTEDVAVNDVIEMGVNESVTFAKLKENDSINGEKVIINIVTNPLNGSINYKTNSYTPNTDFEGLDSFTYQIFDGQTYSNTVTVDVNIGQEAEVVNPIVANDITKTFDGTAIIDAVEVAEFDPGINLSLMISMPAVYGEVTVVNGRFNYESYAEVVDDTFAYYLENTETQQQSNVATVILTSNVEDDPIDDTPLPEPEPETTPVPEPETDTDNETIESEPDTDTNDETPGSDTDSTTDETTDDYDDTNDNTSSTLDNTETTPTSKPFSEDRSAGSFGGLASMFLLFGLMTIRRKGGDV
jgi:hypothetical protein